MIGVATGDIGVERNGERGPHYARGRALLGKYTLIGGGRAARRQGTDCRDCGGRSGKESRVSDALRGGPTPAWTDASNFFSVAPGPRRLSALSGP